MQPCAAPVPHLLPLFPTRNALYGRTPMQSKKSEQFPLLRQVLRAGSSKRLGARKSDLAEIMGLAHLVEAFLSSVHGPMDAGLGDSGETLRADCANSAADSGVNVAVNRADFVNVLTTRPALTSLLFSFSNPLPASDPHVDDKTCNRTPASSRCVPKSARQSLRVSVEESPGSKGTTPGNPWGV